MAHKPPHKSALSLLSELQADQRPAHPPAPVTHDPPTPPAGQEGAGNNSVGLTKPRRFLTSHGSALPVLPVLSPDYPEYPENREYRKRERGTMVEKRPSEARPSVTGRVETETTHNPPLEPPSPLALKGRRIIAAANLSSGSRGAQPVVKRAQSVSKPQRRRHKGGFRPAPQATSPVPWRR